MRYTVSVTTSPADSLQAKVCEPFGTPGRFVLVADADAGLPGGSLPFVASLSRGERLGETAKHRQIALEVLQ